MTHQHHSLLSTVDDIEEVNGRGPWHTKSGGELSVLFSLPFELLQSVFLQYDTDELSGIPKDIRGLRSYRVENIPKGAIGANEWHKLRHELVFALQGSVRWTCEDITGKKKVLTLESGRGVWVRPYILHTYEALTDGASLLVVANTLFLPDDAATHDTYSIESFRDLQVTVAL